MEELVSEMRQLRADVMALQLLMRSFVTESVIKNYASNDPQESLTKFENDFYSGIKTVKKDGSAETDEVWKIMMDEINFQFLQVENRLKGVQENV